VVRLYHVGFYLRISTDKGEGIETLANHKQIIREFCTRKGYTYTLYEEVISGASEERPQFEKLINEIHLYDAVGAISIDRIARNGLHAQIFKQACIRHHKLLITPPTQTYNLNNPQESFLFDNMSAIAEYERQLIRNRIKMNRLSLSYQGKYAPPKAPYGYKRVNQMLEPNEDAEVVKYIFRLSLEGHGDGVITQKLNDEGIPSPSKKRWTRTTVTHLLKNERYTGKLIYNDMEEYYDEKGKRKERIVETVEIDDAFPAIVSKEDFERVQEARKGRNRGKNSREVNKAHTRLLDSLLFCGICGRRLKINRNYATGKGYFIEKCVTMRANGFMCSNTGFREDKVNNEVYEILEKYRLQSNQLAQQLLESNIEGIQKENVKREKQINKQIAEIKEQQNQLVVAFTMKLFTTEQIQNQQNELSKRLKALEEEKESLKQEMTLDKQQEILHRLNHIDEVLKNFRSKPLEEQNRILRSIVKRVEYIREIPPELLKLNANSKARKEYPCKLEIEYL